MSELTRADFPVGTAIEFAESGQEAEVVSIEEHEDHDDYEDATDLIVVMNGQVLRTSTEKVRHA